MHVEQARDGGQRTQIDDLRAGRNGRAHAGHSLSVHHHDAVVGHTAAAVDDLAESERRHSAHGFERTNQQKERKDAAHETRRFPSVESCPALNKPAATVDDEQSACART